MGAHRPDLILSGVNRGANIADDIAYSGTLGAAVTATLLGYRAAALSQKYSKHAAVPWDTARMLAPDVLRRFFVDPRHPPDSCLNINFPDCQPGEVKDVSIVRQGRGSIKGIVAETRSDLRDTDYHWMSFRAGRSSLRGWNRLRGAAG